MDTLHPRNEVDKHGEGGGGHRGGGERREGLRGGVQGAPWVR